jgi:hypothetical protein
MRIPTTHALTHLRYRAHAPTHAPTLNHTLTHTPHTHVLHLHSRLVTVRPTRPWARPLSPALCSCVAARCPSCPSSPAAAIRTCSSAAKPECQLDSLPSLRSQQVRSAHVHGDSAARALAVTIPPGWGCIPTWCDLRVHVVCVVVGTLYVGAYKS